MVVRIKAARWTSMTERPSQGAAMIRTLESQRVIHEMAGLLSTFGHHASRHPEECIPEAEALYDAFMVPALATERASARVVAVNDSRQATIEALDDCLTAEHSHEVHKRVGVLLANLREAARAAEERHP